MYLVNAKQFVDVSLSDMFYSDRTRSTLRDVKSTSLNHVEMTHRSYAALKMESLAS